MQRDLEGACRIGEEVGDATQGLVFDGVEHVQDGAHQQRMAGFFPVVALLQCAFGVHQDVGDVLHVAYLVVAAPHFEQRVVCGRLRIGRVEQQAVAEAAAPAGGEVPVLALDVVDDGGAKPGQQRRNDQAHALAGARGCEGQSVFGTFVAQVLALMQPEEHPGGLGQSGLADFGGIGPAGGAVGGDQAGLA